MPAYTIKNMKRDVEDQAVTYGHSPAMEARFPRDDLDCEKTAFSYQRFAPSAEQPFAHKHANHEEIYLVVGGSGRMMLDDDVVEIERWDAIRVPPETVRSFAAGPDGLEVVAIGPYGMDQSDMTPEPWA